MNIQNEKLDTIVICVSDDKRKRELINLLGDKYLLTINRSLMELARTVKYKSCRCIIIYCNTNEISFFNVLQIRRQFPVIPFIGIIDDANIELARICGLNGIDKLISVGELFKIEKLLQKVLEDFHSKVTLLDFKINLENLSDLTIKALKIIETNYIELKGVSEIANMLSINESTLSREFRNNNLVGPKRILLFFKLKRAITLMKNEGLSLKEITYLSGFSDERRFNECFHKILDCSPGNYRNYKLQAISDDMAGQQYKSWKI